ncbi:MAG: alginate export family protein, partial [Thermodesulfovibrionales bacterium]|nr:alginate export family protein [Thermodesulfovibrionales bacterium]
MIFKNNLLFLDTVFCNYAGNFVFDWKEDSEGTLDRWSEFLTVNSALVRELYVQYTGDLIVKAGRQNIMAGNEGIVIEGPVDALKFTYPLGQTPLGRVSGSLAYIAVAGGFKNYTNFGAGPSGDRSAALGIANKLDGALLSFNIKPKKDLVIEPYILKVFDRGKSGDPDLNLDKDFNTSTISRDGNFEPVWLGLAVSGNEGKVSYMADLIYLTGSYTNARDISAYAFMVRGDYHAGKVGFLNKFSGGLESGMGSGNKADDSAGSKYKNFRGLFLCKDRRKFGNIFSEDLRAGYYLWDSNLANVTFARALSGFEPVKNLKAEIAIAKYWTTESVYKGRGPVPGIDWSSGDSLTTEKTKDIGWGIDLDLNFPIYKRLRGFAEAGYFIPGAVYQRANGQKADPASKIVLGTEFEF